MITSFRSTNFLNLSEQPITLGKSLQALVGPNGSGKSNLILGFRVLAVLASGKGFGSTGEIAPFRSLVFDGDEKKEIGLEVEFITGDRKFRYRIEFSERSFSHESLATIDGAKEELILEAGPKSYTIASSEGAKSNNKTSEAAKLRLAIDSLRAKNDLMAQAHSFIQSWRFHHFSPHEIGKLTQVARKESLDYDGANLAQVLLTLSTSRRREFDEIQAIVRDWVPEIDEITTELDSHSKVQLGTRQHGLERTVTAERLSSGLKGLLAVITALYQRPKPSVLFLEEPENYIHAGLQRRLVELLKTSPDTQVVMATQSPYLVDNLDPSELLVAQRDGGRTTFVTVPNPDKLRELVETEISLGELWFSGSIGGVPEL